MTGSCEHDDEILSSVKCWKFVDELSQYSAAWSKVLYRVVFHGLHLMLILRRKTAPLQVICTCTS